MPAIGEYGLSPYGLGPFGAIAALSLLEAYPLGPRSIYVRFNVPVQMASPLSKGDCQNRSAWTLRRTDSGQRIEVIGAVPLSLPTEKRLILLSSLGPSTVDHSLDGSLLRTATGWWAAPPFVVTFRGVDIDKPTFFPLTITPAIVDFRNDEYLGQGKALRAGASGTYEMQSGATGLKKRILRILTTTAGQNPADATFGVPVTIGELARDPAGIGMRLKEQIRRDPEVSTVSVVVSITEEGIAFIRVRATMKTGQNEAMRFQVNAVGVQYG